MSLALRSTAAAALLLGLSGCNMVVSEEPWFAEADAVPMPVLRDGLWRSDEPDCRVDESKPAEQWPDCAEPRFVRGNERWEMRWDETDARGRPRKTFAGWEWDDDDVDGVLFVANGDHLVIQVPPHAVRPDDVGESLASVEERGAYMYAVFRPRYDDERRVVAFELWPVQCGPLPEQVRSRSGWRRRAELDEPAEPSVTDRPFPGLTVVETSCVAASAEALRGAAVLSAGLREHSRSRWVREGWR